MNAVGITEILSHAVGPFLITFREALEAALIIGIIYAYLHKIGRRDINKYVVFGVGSAVVVSLVLGVMLNILFGGLSGPSEKLFEGVAAITATIVLTYMVFWMAKYARRIKGELEEKIDVSVTKGHLLGITSIAFVAVVREGIETVLFMTALISIDTYATLVGVTIGIIVVATLSFAMMKGVYRLNLRKFFKYTSILLVIFAAGLFGYGVHELMEAGEATGARLGILSQHAFDINPSDPSNPLHEKGVIGSIFKALVGYDGNPEWLRVIAYVGYWIVIGSHLLKTYAPKGLAKSLVFQRIRKVH